MPNFFSFGAYHFFKTVAWHRVVKDDSIGTCLPRCSSSVLSSFRLIQKFCVLIYLPFRSVRYVPWFCHVRRFILSWCIHGIHHCEEYGLPSFLRIFPYCNQTCFANRIAVTRSTNVTHVIIPVVRNCHIVLQRWINLVPSRVTLDGTHVENVSVGVQAILILSFSLPVSRWSIHTCFGRFSTSRCSR